MRWDRKFRFGSVIKYPGMTYQNFMQSNVFKLVWQARDIIKKKLTIKFSCLGDKVFTVACYWVKYYPFSPLVSYPYCINSHVMILSNENIFHR